MATSKFASEQCHPEPTYSPAPTPFFGADSDAVYHVLCRLTRQTLDIVN